MFMKNQKNLLQLNQHRFNLFFPLKQQCLPVSLCTTAPNSQNALQQESFFTVYDVKIN